MGRSIILVLLGFGIATVAANVVYRVNAAPVIDTEAQAWSHDRMEFVAWNGVEWTAWIHDGAFELVPRQSGRWHRHRSASIAFTGWNGERWQAKVDGDVFVLARDGNWDGEVITDSSIRYRDWRQNKRLRTVEELQR